MRVGARTARRRLAAVLLILVAGGLLQLGGATPGSARSPGGTVTVTPQKIAPGGILTLSGWCARVLLPDGSLGPPAATTGVVLDAIRLLTVQVDQTTGTWGPATATVPAGTAAGDHTIRSECGGVGTFTAVAAPTAPALTVTPGRASLPVTVTIAGTCAPGTTSVQLFLDGARRAVLDINQAVGEIQSVTVDLGTDTPISTHRFTTSCGGTATFTAVAAPGQVPATTSGPVPGTTSAPAPGSSPAVPSAAPATEPVPQPASGNGVLWVILGTAAALLTLLGGTLWALLRGGGRGGPRGTGRPGAPHGPVTRPAAQPPTLIGDPPAG
jgi:hypothetical protein